MAYYQTSDRDNIIGQCWVAVGKGVGQKQMSAEAVGVVAERYLAMVGEIRSDWDSYAEEVLAFATGLGILAAAKAEEQLSPVISAENVDAALGDILRPCPCEAEMS